MSLILLVVWASNIFDNAQLKKIAMVSNLIRIAPTPIIASKVNNIEPFTYSGDILINRTTKIPIHHSLVNVACSHKQISLEFILFFTNKVYDKNYLKVLTHRLLCQQSCLSSTIKKNYSIKNIESFKFTLSNRNGVLINEIEAICI